MAASPTDGLTLAAMAQFNVLQQRFVAGLPKRWLEIRDAGDAPSLRQALHRLAGAAASFGFARIGQYAREAEALLLQDRDCAALQPLLAQLQAEMARSQAG